MKAQICPGCRKPIAECDGSRLGCGFMPSRLERPSAYELADELALIRQRLSVVIQRLHSGPAHPTEISVVAVLKVANNAVRQAERELATEPQHA